MRLPAITRTIPAFRNDFEGQCRRIKAAGIDAVEIHQSVFEKTLNGDLDLAHIERAQKGYLADLGMHGDHLQHQHLDQPEVPARAARAIPIPPCARRRWTRC